MQRPHSFFPIYRATVYALTNKKLSACCRNFSIPSCPTLAPWNRPSMRVSSFWSGEPGFGARSTCMNSAGGPSTGGWSGGGSGREISPFWSMTRTSGKPACNKSIYIEGTWHCMLIENFAICYLVRMPVYILRKTIALLHLVWNVYMLNFVLL